MPVFAVVMGLMAAASVALLACPVPPKRAFTLDNVLVYGVYYPALVAAAGAIGARLVSRVSKAGMGRMASIAVWIAPVAIYLRQRSMLAIGAAVLLAAALIREHPPLETEPAPAQLLRQFPSSLLAALLIQITAIAILADRLLPAVACAMAAAAILVHSAARAGFHVRRRFMPLILSVPLMFTTGGLSRYLAPGGGSAAASNSASSNQQPEDSASGVGTGGEYTGIILFPEAEKHTILVPPLPSMRRDLFHANQKNPLTIPFYGAYWFFRPPNRRPPPNSVVVRGSPDLRSFRSTSRIPLMMEAHQNLGTPIDLACCSQIQLAIRNRDRTAALVAIELMLVDTSRRPAPFQSLGTQPVTSAAPAAETLTYPLPANAHISQFDELTIRFHRNRVREDRSARIAIEKFVLVPRF